MSAQSLALWNALPMQPSLDSHTLLKRSRSDYERADDDDDISIASRSPSPTPRDAMEVDQDSLYNYDGFIRGAAREVITVETKIKSTNKGFAMLANMGWKEGQPLGLSADGRVDPIPFQAKNDSTGLGKLNQDVLMIETTVSQRRELDSERQHKETEGQRRAREEAVAKRAALEVEISSTLKAFFCSLCDKQFKNVAQYDEHTNSYAHHHKVRAKDMQANARIMPKEELDKRKEKERRREEKEMRKMAAAIGIKLAKPSVAPGFPSLSVPTEAGSSDFPSNSGKTVGAAHSGFRKSGWATVSSPASQQSPFASSSAIQKDFAATSSQQPPSSQVTGDWTHLISPASPYEVNDVQHFAYTSAHFRAGGWSSLDSDPASPLTPCSHPQDPQLTASMSNNPKPLMSKQATPTLTSSHAQSSWQKFNTVKR